ncbi:MAG: polysaccharide biosynthesis tyrosine autokinase [Armatimonadetes bacterium]|nr:polysaccharide biosynthesis tyrosine autokinase [Armatimonadota bacterium]
MEQVKREFEIRDYVVMLGRRKWWFIVAFVAVMTGGIVYTLSREPIYQATAQLLITTSRERPAEQGTGEIIVEREDIPTQLQILRSSGLFQRAFEKLPINLRRGGIKDQRIDQVRNTNIVTINIQSPNPQTAAAMANAMAETYVTQSLERNREATANALKFVQAQIAIARRELTEAEDALKAFRERTEVMEAGSATSQAVGRLENAEGSLRQMEIERAAVAAQLDRVRQQKARTEPTLVSEREMATNPLVETLKNQLLQLQMQRMALATEYVDSSRKIKQLDEQMAVLQARLNEEVDKVVASEKTAPNPVAEELTKQQNQLESNLLSIEARIRKTRAEMPALRAAVLTMPREQVEYDRLQRRVQASEKIYTELLSREQALLIAQESKVANAAIVSMAATPTRPVSPNVQQNLIVAAVLGLLIGFVLALYVDYVDESIKEPEEAEQLLGLPLLGTIGYVQEMAGLTGLDTDRPSGLEEAFRKLRANVGFAGREKGVVSVVVTSCGPDEGKSTVATNVAIAAAHAGQRTVLIDADLRAPSLHQVFGVVEAKGLTNLLAEEATLPEVLVETSVSGLKLVPGGPRTSNPVQLLDSPQMRQMLATLREQADFIVLDTSPLAAVVDAQIVASQADGVVLVFENKSTPRDALRKSYQALLRSGANVLGTVATKVRGLEKEYYYRYGQSDT